MLKRARWAATWVAIVTGCVLDACTPGHGPHIHMSSPPAPNFGDPAPDAHSYGGAGGGGYGGASMGGENRSRSSPATTAGVIAAGVVGGSALAVTLATQGVVCEPGGDSTAQPDAGTAINVCSGERKPAAPDVERAFRPVR